MNDITLFKHPKALHFKHIRRKADIKKTDECDGYLLETSEKEARRIIDSLKGSSKKIAVVGADASFNRRAIETLKVQYLVAPERGEKKDTLKQRDSGLNHVVAKEAARKKISIVIDIRDLTKISQKEKAKRIARVIQNIKVCRKARCQIQIASFAKNKTEVASEKQRHSIGFSLGMASNQVAKATSFT